MSRVAKNPVVLPSGVEVTVQNGQVCVKGKNGNLSLSLPSCVSVDIRDNKELVFKPANQDKHSLSMSGNIDDYFFVLKDFYKEKILDRDRKSVV